MQVLLTLAYDGTRYAGWQRQENATAVQQVLEEALTRVLKPSIVLDDFSSRIVTVAAGRTDAGVHALGQRVGFFIDELLIPLDKLPQVLNGALPPDIAVQKAEQVSDDFHPRFHPRMKTYMYRFYNAPAPNPLLARYSTFVPRLLDVSAMQKAAGHFIGRHDFIAFCAAGGSAKTTVREVYACKVSCETTPGSKNINLTVTGNAFLYNMVRIIAGTVLYAGLGKIKPDDVPGIIKGRDRTKAGKTMPPEGLVLVGVEY